MRGDARGTDRSEFFEIQRAFRALASRVRILEQVYDFARSIVNGTYIVNTRLL